MKIYLIISCCLFLSINYEPVSGGLVPELFEKVNNITNNAKEDIANAAHFNEQDSKAIQANIEKNIAGAEVETVTKNVKKDNGVSITTLIISMATTASSATKIETTQSTQVTTMVTPTTTAGTETITTSTDGEGRENFKASCLPGYQRTTDGRCKSNF